MISKYCAENPKTWDTKLSYLSFVYTASIHRKTRATPFGLVLGQECQYPIDLFYAKPHDELLTKDGFAEELDELSEMLIAVPEKSLGRINDVRRISIGRKFMENHTQLEIKSGCGRRKSSNRGSTLIHGKDLMLYWRECLK